MMSDQPPDPTPDKAAVAARRLALRWHKLHEAQARFMATVRSGEWQRGCAANDRAVRPGMTATVEDVARKAGVP
jgi:hypothetical protein